MTHAPDLDQVKSYFDQRIREHGATPQGSDWNSVAAQQTRFEQLLKVIEVTNFSLLDYGCGYGALADTLAEKGYLCDYIGYDIVESAIKTAQELHEGKGKRAFISSLDQLPPVDYTVSSGIFNFRGNHSYEAWTDYVLDVLHQMDRLSTRGFASNFLTSYSDADRMRPDLYYARPGDLFDYCKRNFSRNVALLHDYRIYDFTLIIRKD